ASAEASCARFARSSLMRRSLLLGTAIIQMMLAQGVFGSGAAQAQAQRPHNVVLFIADGLRFRMVDDNTAPTMAAIARQGVSLRNGHGLFSTFTMANASGMADGLHLDCTGSFF